MHKRYENGVIEVAGILIGVEGYDCDALADWLRWRLTDGWIPSTRPERADLEQSIHTMARHALALFERQRTRRGH